MIPSRVILPAEVRRAGGTVWWSGEGGCLVAALDVASGRVRRVEDEKECALWPAPDGTETVAMVGRPADLFVDRRLVLFGRRNVPAPSALRLPFSYLPAAWREDGSAFAFCFTAPTGPVVRVVARDRGWRTIDDACHPAWLGDGRLVVARTDPPSIQVGGRTVLGEHGLGRLLTGAPTEIDLSVRALAARGERIVAGVIADEKGQAIPPMAGVAVVSAGGSIDARRKLLPGTLPAVVGLSPDGGRFWYLDGARHEGHSFSVVGLWPLALRDFHWLAWAPGGRYLAAATPDGVVLADGGGAELAVVRTSAQQVYWTLTPRRGAGRTAASGGSRSS